MSDNFYFHLDQQFSGLYCIQTAFLELHINYESELVKTRYLDRGCLNREFRYGKMEERFRFYVLISVPYQFITARYKNLKVLL